MTDWGIKITKPGASTTSTDPRDILMSSKYSMLKFHDVVDTTVTINGGSKTGTVTIPHTLGYTPAFMAFAYGTDFGPQSPLNNIGILLPIYASQKSGNPSFEAYTNSTGITVTATLPEIYNQYVYTTAGIWGFQYDDGSGNEYYVAGKHGSFGTGMFFRWADINIEQGEDIVEAIFEYQNVHCTAGSDIKFKTYGIDQDDTSDPYDYDDANSKPKTSAVNVKTQNAETSNFNYGDNVTSIIQEIIDRPGWQNGNAIGLINNDNGSDDSHAMKQMV